MNHKLWTTNYEPHIMNQYYEPQIMNQYYEPILWTTYYEPHSSCFYFAHKQSKEIFTALLSIPSEHKHPTMEPRQHIQVHMARTQTLSHTHSHTHRHTQRHTHRHARGEETWTFFRALFCTTPRTSASFRWCPWSQEWSWQTWPGRNNRLIN